MPRAKMRKRIKLHEGDVLQLSLPDERFGYAVVVDRGVLPSGGAPYIALFGSAYTGWPDEAKLAKDRLALAGWTTDALLYRDRWKIMTLNFPIPPLPLPNFKVEQAGICYVTDYRGEFIDRATSAELELLDYRFSVTAGIFQSAFEALHGSSEWKDNYQKLTLAHAQKRMTRIPRAT